MKKKVISALLCAAMLTASLTGCSGETSDSGNSREESSGTESAGQESSGETAAAESGQKETPDMDFAGEELSILVSAGWMDNRYDDTIARFEETYDVTVDLQTIPADQYSDILQSKLSTDSCADIFWIQSNPFAISSVIVDPEKYCIDFSDAGWKGIMPEARLSSCEYEGKLYGLQIWHNSPEYVMTYNKTLFEELNLEVPTSYAELLNVCEKIAAEGITPWFLPE